MSAQLEMFYVFSLSVQNHSITILKNYPLDYKLFHNTDSEVVKKMNDEGDPWKYPFCDLFLYKYNKWKHRVVLRKRRARLWWPSNYYEVSLSYSNGTYLTNFGDFQMRVPTDSEKVLYRQMGENWRYIATTHNFNHYTLEEIKKEVKFFMSPALFLPAKPFR